MGKRIGEDHTQVGGRRSHRDIAGEAVKRAKNVDSVTAVDTVSPVENTVTYSLRMRKEQAWNPEKRETAIPNMGQGLAEETKASHLVQRLR